MQVVADDLVDWKFPQVSANEGRLRRRCRRDRSLPAPITAFIDLAITLPGQLDERGNFNEAPCPTFIPTNRSL